MLFFFWLPFLKITRALVSSSNIKLPSCISQPEGLAGMTGPATSSLLNHAQAGRGTGSEVSGKVGLCLGCQALQGDHK